MTPTNELRFVERQVQHTYATTITVRVLQQKWQSIYWNTDESGCKYQEEEWRDVPCVKEEV